jgi:hypothetical protein
MVCRFMFLLGTAGSQVEMEIDSQGKNLALSLSVLRV